MVSLETRSKAKAPHLQDWGCQTARELLSRDESVFPNGVTFGLVFGKDLSVNAREDQRAGMGDRECASLGAGAQSEPTDTRSPVCNAQEAEGGRTSSHL